MIGTQEAGPIEADEAFIVLAGRPGGLSPGKAIFIGDATIRTRPELKIRGC